MWNKKQKEYQKKWLKKKREENTEESKLKHKEMCKQSALKIKQLFADRYRYYWSKEHPFDETY